jgi:hypothetical protein
VLPLIRWRRLTWAERLLAVAATLFMMAVALGLAVHADQAFLGGIVGWIITILIYLAVLAYFGTQLSRVTAAAATRLIIALGIIFLYGFPPLLAFLATNGGSNFPSLLLQQFNSGDGWLSIIQLILQALVPLLLIVLPEILRRRLAYAERSKTVDELLPIQLTFAAVLATGLYAVTLHFANGPLAKISINQLAFAILAVAVLLSPFYRYIATVCWERGIADVFNPGNWVNQQQELAKLLRKAFARSTENVLPDGLPNDSTISPETEIDMSTSGPAGARPD